MGNGRRTPKQTPFGRKQEEEPTIIMFQRELRRKKQALGKRTAEDVYEVQQPELPKPETRRKRGRPRKRDYMTQPDEKPQPEPNPMPLEENGPGEVGRDGTPNPEIVVDLHQAVGEAKAPLNVKGCMGKEVATDEQSDALLSTSGSLDLTQIVEQIAFDLKEPDELGSRQDEARVSVHGYEVKAEVAPILKLMFSQFGDLAKDCILPSIKSRARHLESICTIYQRLEALSFKDIKTQELNSMLEEVIELEILKVKVGWLRKWLDDISVARRAFEEKQRNVVAARNRRKALEVYEKELEGHKKELERCKEKVKAVKEKICEEEKALAAEEAKGKKISEMFSDVKSTLKAFCQKSSLAQDLLGSI